MGEPAPQPDEYNEGVLELCASTLAEIDELARHAAPPHMRRLRRLERITLAMQTGMTAGTAVPL